MGRARRAYLPGSFFHLIGRTQARIHWFEDAIKDRIVEIIADAVEESDVALSAFVVMENHFHLLVRQGSAPLAAFMQPVMRRTALLLKARLQLEDHIFGAPYWHRALNDGGDLRTCIRYVHRNPVRAGCCSDPGDYPWSSHNAYARVLAYDRWRPRMFVLRALFGNGSFRSQSELCADYLRFVSDDVGTDAPSSSIFVSGDAFARDLFAFTQRAGTTGLSVRKRPDLRDVVQRGLNDLCPDLDIEMVRSFRGAWIARVRATLVRRAARAGHRGCEIARYFKMSESRVSRIIRDMPAEERYRRFLP